MRTDAATWQAEVNVSVPVAQTSLASYDASAWLPVTTPCTVMGGLIQNGRYADVYRGLALQQVSTAQFNHTSWLFRSAAFAAPAGAANVQLLLKGLSYRGLIFLNGAQITPAELYARRRAIAVATR